MTGSAQLIRANALDLPLPDSSVDLVVTSPPYFALRAYKDGGETYAGQLGAEPTPEQFIDALIAATAEMVRVLKPSGSIWVNLGDKYAGSGGNNNSNLSERATRRGPSTYTQAANAPHKSLMGIPWRYAIRCIDDLGLILRAEVIWAKPNGLPESVTDRVRRSHEQWFHFTKSPGYFSAVDEIREQHAVVSIKRFQPHRAPSGVMHGDSIGAKRMDMTKACNPLGKLPGSVWTIPTEPLIVPDDLGVDHFAAFPTEWPRRIILGWSPADGVVLDPFAGTGTTVAVAKALGRTGIGTDLSADYLRLANWRCDGDGYRKIERKVHERTHGAPPARRTTPTVDPQPSLFGDVA